MENNEIMNSNNEEVIEATTEEIVKTASNGGMKKATTIGLLTMIAGALAYKFVVVPAAEKFKNWRENRKTIVNQPQSDTIDGEVVDLDEETEDDSE